MSVTLTSNAAGALAVALFPRNYVESMIYIFQTAALNINTGSTGGLSLMVPGPYDGNTAVGFGFAVATSITFVP